MSPITSNKITIFMKKIVMAMLAIGFLASCGSNQTAGEAIDTTKLIVDTIKQDTINTEDTTVKVEISSETN